MFDIEGEEVANVKECNVCKSLQNSLDSLLYAREKMNQPDDLPF